MIAKKRLLSIWATVKNIANKRKPKYGWIYLSVRVTFKAKYNKKIKNPNIIVEAAENPLQKSICNLDYLISKCERADQIKAVRKDIMYT